MASSKYESRFKDITRTSYAADTTGSITLLNGVSVGSTVSARLGRKVAWREVHVTGKLVASADTIKSSRCDLYLVWDQQPGAALPGMTDIFTQSLSGAPKNLNYRERFKILRRQYFILGADVVQASTSKEPSINLVEVHEPLYSSTVYKGDGDAIGDISYGALYLVTVGDQAQAVGGTFSLSVRLRWSEF